MRNRLIKMAQATGLLDKLAEAPIFPMTANLRGAVDYAGQAAQWPARVTGDPRYISDWKNKAVANYTAQIPRSTPLAPEQKSYSTPNIRVPAPALAGGVPRTNGVTYTNMTPSYLAQR